jgi:hypothetical protein
MVLFGLLYARFPGDRFFSSDRMEETAEEEKDYCEESYIPFHCFSLFLLQLYIPTPYLSVEKLVCRLGAID